MSYVNFRSLSNISDIGWDLDGVITFYESPVNIINCNFTKNLKGTDYLNIIRTDFNIKNTIFDDIHANAICSGFSTGKIENTIFKQIGNDAIKTVDSKLQIEGIKIMNSQSNAINGCQNSQLIGENVIITGGKISILSKDNASIKINGLTIDSSEVAYCAFQEKSGYGPAKIITTNATINNVNIEYLIENNSSLSFNGALINKKSENIKERIYGTRNTKTTE